MQYNLGLSQACRRALPAPTAKTRRPLIGSVFMSTLAGEAGFVLSDLHIFSLGSRYHHALPVLEQAAASHRVIVLNGDSFDFKRSRFANNAETSRHAIEWISGLLLRHPETSFHYVVGNHDCNPSFLEQLLLVEKRASNLRVSADTLKIGACLFIHGDACDLPAGDRSLAALRERYGRLERSLASIAFAQVVTRLRLNAVEHIRHSRRRLCDKLLSYLEAAHPSELSSTERIYFGHTHVPFRDFHHRGFLFFNTGSAVRGLTFAPLEFPLP